MDKVLQIRNRWQEAECPPLYAKLASVNEFKIVVWAQVKSISDLGEFTLELCDDARLVIDYDFIDAAVDAHEYDFDLLSNLHEPLTFKINQTQYHWGYKFLFDCTLSSLNPYVHD